MGEVVVQYRYKTHTLGFKVEFACSPRVCVGFLRVLRFPPTSKDMHRQC